MAKGLRNVQLIRAGTWSGSAGPVLFGVGDLEDIVRSFAALGSKYGFRPHLKLGHTEAQKFFGQRAGFPSLGEVVNVWRDGEIVYADIDNVPEPLLDLIEKRRYTQLSIELYPTYEHDGVKYRNVLAAVALLGAELPAVKGLSDLANSLYKEEATLFSEATGKQEFTDMADKPTDEAALQARIDAAVAAAVEAATKPLKIALEAANVANEALTSRIANSEAANRTAKIEGIVDAAIKDGRIAPKNRASYVAMGEAQAASAAKIVFGEGDKKVEKTGLEAFAEMIGGLAKVVELGETGTSKVPDPKVGEGKTAGERVDAMAAALVKEGKAKTYAEAIGVVLSDPANATLKSEYALGQ